MNLALSSIIIVFLLLPALFFRALIIQSDSLKNPLDTSIKTELGIVFFIAIIIHLSAIFILETLNICHIQPEQIYYILNGDSKIIDRSSLVASFFPFLEYTFILTTISSILAVLLKELILKYYLDIKSPYLPVSNEWDKLLSGRIFEYDRISKINDYIKEAKSARNGSIKFIKNNPKFSPIQKKQKIKLTKKQTKETLQELRKERKIPPCTVEVDVLVPSSSGDLIYKGSIHKYYLGKDNTLDRIILKDAFRRKFKPEASDYIDAENEFKEFESKLFIIRHEEIKNMNIRFTFIEEA